MALRLWWICLLLHYSEKLNDEKFIVYQFRAQHFWGQGFRFRVRLHAPSQGYCYLGNQGRSCGKIRNSGALKTCRCPHPSSPTCSTGWGSFFCAKVLWVRHQSYETYSMGFTTVPRLASQIQHIDLRFVGIWSCRQQLRKPLPCHRQVELNMRFPVTSLAVQLRLI